MPCDRPEESGKQQEGDHELEKRGFRGKVCRARCRMEESIEGTGKLCREGFYGADPHINSEGAGQVQVYRAAVQEKNSARDGNSIQFMWMENSA